MVKWFGVLSLVIHLFVYSDAEIMDRLLTQSLEGIRLPTNQLTGEDLCAGCDDELCNQMESCGYVQVKLSELNTISTLPVKLRSNGQHGHNTFSE